MGKLQSKQCEWDSQIQKLNTLQKCMQEYSTSTSWLIRSWTYEFMIEVTAKSSGPVVDLAEQVTKDELKGYIAELHVEPKKTEGEDLRIVVQKR